MTNPSPDIFFATQQNGEQIQMLLRRHLITNVFWIQTTLLLLILPLIYWTLPRSVTEIVIDPSVAVFIAPHLVILIPLYYTTVLFYAYLKFLAWFFSVIIITNQRVLDIDYHPPLVQHTAQAQLEEIQDISEKQTGLFATLFNFGDILIQTAGSNQNIFLRRTPDPHQIHTQIMQLLHHNSRRKKQKTAASSPGQASSNPFATTFVWLNMTLFDDQTIGISLWLERGLLTVTTIMSLILILLTWVVRHKLTRLNQSLQTKHARTLKLTSTLFLTASLATLAINIWLWIDNLG